MGSDLILFARSASIFSLKIFAEFFNLFLGLLGCGKTLKTFDRTYNNKKPINTMPIKLEKSAAKKMSGYCKAKAK